MSGIKSGYFEKSRQPLSNIFLTTNKKAERTRFELVIPFRGIHAFQACLFNHSSTSPYFPIRKQTMEIYFPQKKQQLKSCYPSGETGIRTPGTSQYNGFQDRRNRPLCHLSKTSFSEVLFVKSGAKVRTFFKHARVSTKKIREDFLRIAISRYFMLKSIKQSIFMLII